MNSHFRLTKDIFINSLTFNLFAEFLNTAKTSLKYWALARFSEPENGINPSILETSAAVRRALAIWESFQDKASESLTTSLAAHLTNTAKKDLYYFPLKFYAVFIITAISVNALSLVIHKVSTGPFYWTTRGTLLFLAFGGLFCDADWKTLKSGSMLVNRLFK
ncbi:MAG: hypothetical protein V1933_06560 [Candidatus Omnitrophota bacterium]